MMKTRVLSLVVTMIFVVSISFAEDKITIEDTYGTWINSDYNVKQYGRAKEINHPDGTAEWYYRVTDIEPGFTLKYTIKDSWYDKEGNFWIKCTFYTIEENSTSYMLFKFSNSGKIRESVWSGVKYPDEMSPIGGNYRIHYRQE
jgi:hypothetical protein